MLTLQPSEESSLLVEQFIKGDHAAFSKIFDDHWKGLYQYAIKKINSKEDAEEIIQSLFLELWEKKERLRITDLEGFLRVCVRNKCVDYIRRKAMQGRYVEYVESYNDYLLEKGDDSIAYYDISDQILKGLDQLPEKSQLVFKLSRLEGLSVKEVAQKIQLSEKAVEYHLTKALRTMKVCLRDFVLLLALFAS